MATPKGLLHLTPFKHFPEELPELRGGRRAKYFLAHSVFHDISTLKESNLVACLSGKSHFVRDDDKSYARTTQLAYHIQNLGGVLRVECTGRFVKKQELWVWGDGTRYGNTLTLTS